MLKNYSLKNNKGFSLMELLIVVALFSIMSGLAAISLSMAKNADVSKCAHAFDSAYNTAKVQCMAKGVDRGTLHLIKQDGGLYYSIGDEVFPTRICTGAIKFRIEYVNGGIAEGDTAISDGEFESISFNSAGMVNSKPTDIRKVVFYNNNRTIEVVLYGETGKHEVVLK